jgi:hypothetical protein
MGSRRSSVSTASARDQRAPAEAPGSSRENSILFGTDVRGGQSAVSDALRW